MYSSHLNYLPLAFPFFFLLAGLFVLLIVLIQVQVLRFAYMRLGISSATATILLLASLIGSYVNIPVAHLPQQEVMSDQVVNFFGMRYVVPLVESWPDTVIAVNVGGAVIPGLLSLFLLVKHKLWVRAAVATGCVAIVCHLIAQPVPGVGIAIPGLIPPVVTAIVAYFIAETNVAAIAYISGSIGTLIGADLLNLDKLQGLGAPVASIGGAGTFDGIFLTGMLAVLFASLSFRR
jgi:uncharacterized membrane protein